MRWRGRRTVPAVSIVVPTHNRAPLLGLTLDSLLGQDYAELEVLVLDDGSTDETSEVLARYSGAVPRRRLRVERHENMGQAATVNRGYALARGELLGFLSDDDLAEPRMVSTLVEALARHPDAVAAYPAYRVIDGAGATVDTWLPLPYTSATALSRHDTIVGPGGLARRTAVEASGGWDPAYRWMGDLVLWMGIARFGELVRVEAPLAAWRKHSGGVTAQTAAARALEHLRLFEHGMRLCPSASQRAELRAAALHTACVLAAWFSRHTEYAPGEPIAMIDHDRPLISAWASGQDPATRRFDERQARAVAAALRSLGELTMRLADRRAPDRGAVPGGYEQAMTRLRSVGLLRATDGSAAPLDEARIGEVLIDAALDCRADIAPGKLRFLVPDRRQSAAVREELGTLVGLTLGGPAHGSGLLAAIREQIARRESDLAST